MATNDNSHGHVGDFSYDEIEKISNHLLAKTKHRPVIGIVCGSGLAGLGQAVEEQDVFKYSDIPGFPDSTVKGHVGQLVFGMLEGKAVVCMQGRFHLYEGGSIYKTTLPIRVMIQAGIKVLFVTNAAGGVNESYSVGDIMVMQDHIGFPLMSGCSPLVGPNDDRFGPRFPSLQDAYDKGIAKHIAEVSKELDFGSFMRKGTYCMVSGPAFETPAEIRFLRVIGADAVGMSTVPEVAVARHAGVKVAGFSLITNKCVSDYEDHPAPEHEEVLKVGKKRGEDLQKLLKKVISRLEL